MRRQTAIPPVDVATYAGWTMPKVDCQDMITHFSIHTDANEMAGLGFEDLCDVIADAQNGDLDEWKEWYVDTFSEPPKARWSKVLVIQALVDAYLQNPE